MTLRLSATALAIASMLAAPAAFAEMVKFKADLAATQEVPPADSAATGTADITLDTETKQLSWTSTNQGLSGAATAAHFHGPAKAGANAAPVVDVTASVAQGSATLTDEQIAQLQAGDWYLNVHTEKFPDGEIRGQVEKVQ